MSKRRALRVLAVIVPLLLSAFTSYSQENETKRRAFIEKRYNIFFRINSPVIDYGFKDNKRTIEQMVEDIQTTLEIDGAVPNQLLILSTASPDGGYAFNQALARNRARSTEKLLLELFPQFKDANIQVDFLEEDWDGLLQILKAHPEFPQREEMMAVINSTVNINTKEWRLRQLKQGWRYLTRNYVYALRNSSVTLRVIMTADNADDEFVREDQPIIETIEPSTTPVPVYQREVVMPPMLTIKHDPKGNEPLMRKTLFAARSNLLLPALNIGVEVPIGTNWSVGFDYYYPWAVSATNKWCTETLAWFADGKYWFTGDKHKWSIDSKLKGHAVGVYAGIGYYDFQNKERGRQGEFLDLGVDYTFALPVADDKLRILFNIGIGYIRTQFRPYNPSSDYSDLIKEPGIKYRTSNFFGPTRVGISLEYPITVKVKATPKNIEARKKFESVTTNGEK